VIHTVKGFGIVNKAEIDVFLELSCFFSDPADVGNLISGSSAFSKTSLNIWKFTDHVLLKPGLENFECYFTGVWDECSCAVVWAFLGIAFLWVWNDSLSSHINLFPPLTYFVSCLTFGCLLIYSMLSPFILFRSLILNLGCSSESSKELLKISRPGLHTRPIPYAWEQSGQGALSLSDDTNV